MKVLVINCGSSSLKFQLINSEDESVLAKGLCERIGSEGSRLVYSTHKIDKKELDKDLKDHTDAVQMVIDTLTDKEIGVIESLKDVDAVGHRIVHGGENFSKSVVIDDEVIKAIEACNDLAPLHNPANLIGIKACEKLMPHTKMVAVFDTAFHQTMPEKAYMYGIPYEYYDEYKVRRYGFHGTSHSFVSERAAEMIGKPLSETKTIVCHLGNGASITAVKNGKSVDTSMGLTPLEGIIMGTRSGSIDPAIISFLANKENISVNEVIDILNKKSGVLGMSGISSDFRDITKAMEEGNERAKMTMDAYCYSVAKYIGSYITAMNGVDVIAFTAGVGENNPYIRKEVCSYFKYLGVEIDDEANSQRTEDAVISTDKSKVKVLLVATNEELKIARETLALI